jgi:hypothetical protein
MAIAIVRRKINVENVYCIALITRDEYSAVYICILIQTNTSTFVVIRTIIITYEILIARWIR